MFVAAWKRALDPGALDGEIEPRVVPRRDDRAQLVDVRGRVPAVQDGAGAQVIDGVAGGAQIGDELRGLGRRRGAGEQRAITIGEPRTQRAITGGGDRGGRGECRLAARGIECIDERAQRGDLGARPDAQRVQHVPARERREACGIGHR